MFDRNGACDRAAMQPCSDSEQMHLSPPSDQIMSSNDYKGNINCNSLNMTMLHCNLEETSNILFTMNYGNNLSDMSSFFSFNYFYQLLEPWRRCMKCSHRKDWMTCPYRAMHSKQVKEGTYVETL